MLRLPGAAEAAFAAFRVGRKLVYIMQGCLNHRLKHQLRNTVARLNDVCLLAIICQNHANLAVVVSIDDTNALGDPNAMF